MAEFASKGVAGSGLGLGIAGTALGLLNGGLGNILGTGMAHCQPNNGFGSALDTGMALGLLRGGLSTGSASGCACSEDHWINRYEATQQARIAELETEVKLRDANTYTLSEMGKLRDYMDRRFEAVNSQLCSQAVVNAQITANISCMQSSISALQGLTKTIIPIGNVCPEPMPALNSWTAPTA